MYILTEVEYKALCKSKALKKLKNTEQMQELCSRIANNMPIKWTWGDGKTTPEPWGCKLTTDFEWYCDQCPVVSICPSDKQEFSN
jgi:hypothetical protein